MNKIHPIEQNNQRVLLTSQLAEEYETTTDTITKNFNRNIERYQEGKHYYCLQGDNLRDFRANGQIDLLPSNLNKLYLWTEKGALLHAKSLNTDRAWEVYDQLVENYFKPRSTLPRDYPSALRALADEAEKRMVTESKNLMLKQKVCEYEPKAQYVDTILNSVGILATTQIAADYGMSANKLNKILFDEHIQRKVGDQWILYKEHMNLGYTKSETIHFKRSDGAPDTKLQTKWTQKGRLMIHYLLEKRGIKANVDKQDAKSA